MTPRISAKTMTSSAKFSSRPVLFFPFGNGLTFSFFQLCRLNNRSFCQLTLPLVIKLTQNETMSIRRPYNMSKSCWQGSYSNFRRREPPDSSGPQYIRARHMAGPVALSLGLGYEPLKSVEAVAAGDAKRKTLCGCLSIHIEFSHFSLPGTGRYSCSASPRSSAMGGSLFCALLRYSSPSPQAAFCSRDWAAVRLPPPDSPGPSASGPPRPPAGRATPLPSPGRRS